VRYGALFHDIGKVKTRSISPDGEVHFFGHAEVGARMFDKMERRGKLFGHEQTLRDEVRFLVLHHLRASQYDGKWTDSAVRRFAREIGPSLDNLLCLSRADITTKRPEKKRRGINMIDSLAERITELAAHKNRQIITMCHHGVRSLNAAALLRKLGFANTHSMAGGIDAYSIMADPAIARY
jgi:poly(A) polymerase